MTSEKMLQYVEYRLQQWADWYGRGNLYGLGYPPCSTEYRLMTEGNVVRTLGAKPIASNEQAEEIEALVIKMSEQNHIMAIVLRCHYFNGKSVRKNTAQLTDLGMNISYSYYKYTLEMGKQWLAGYLSAQNFF